MTGVFVVIGPLRGCCCLMMEKKMFPAVPHSLCSPVSSEVIDSGSGGPCDSDPEKYVIQIL